MITVTKPAEPVVMRYQDLERRVWGDETTGRLVDWFYADDAELNLNIVGMPPNGVSAESPANPTIFGADELFYVIEGTMVQSNPVTGEVFVVKPGEAIFFRKDTWHYQWNYSNTQLRMLEFFQPAPKSRHWRRLCPRAAAAQRCPRSRVRTSCWAIGRWRATNLARRRRG